jgi:hypothetical protein
MRSSRRTTIFVLAIMASVVASISLYLHGSRQSAVDDESPQKLSFEERRDRQMEVIGRILADNPDIHQFEGRKISDFAELFDVADGPYKVEKLWEDDYVTAQDFDKSQHGAICGYKATISFHKAPGEGPREGDSHYWLEFFVKNEEILRVAHQGTVYAW